MNMIEIALDDLPTTMSNDYDPTEVSGASVVVDTDHIRAAHDILRAHPFVEAVEVEASVDVEETDGKIRGGFVRVSRYGAWCHYANEWTGTEWSVSLNGEETIPQYSRPVLEVNDAPL